MDPLHFLQIILLALIQGAAELLPVSSSAHVILAQELMGMDPSNPKNVFMLVMLHTGTMFAVLVYFWPRWRRLLTVPADVAKESPRWHYLKMIVLATACTGFVGLGLKVFIEQIVLVRMMGYDKGEVEVLFKELPLIAAALGMVGVFILLSGFWEHKSQDNRLTTRSSIWIGLVQGLCLPFRGFSRSGATISAGLVCGVSRSLAEDFSFALAVVLTPPVQVYSLHKLLKDSSLTSATLMEALLPGLLGMVFSFVAGLFALRLLSAVLEKGRWGYFGYYCLGFAAVVLAAHFLML
ncbi:MAG TPA: undecaprenyl-diphosphate phosphatase [Gemmataceae bacterium]|nr:undecaprenyl-diphosphate phosphatase [Gemmataceae bacterium]